MRASPTTFGSATIVVHVKSYGFITIYKVCKHMYYMNYCTRSINQ